MRWRECKFSIYQVVIAFSSAISLPRSLSVCVSIALFWHLCSNKPIINRPSIHFRMQSILLSYKLYWTQWKSPILKRREWRTCTTVCLNAIKMWRCFGVFGSAIVCDTLCVYSIQHSNNQNYWPKLQFGSSVYFNVCLSDHIVWNCVTDIFSSLELSSCFFAFLFFFSFLNAKTSVSVGKKFLFILSLNWWNMSPFNH